MRALCGAIITAGAVIGLGLMALGLGTRYTRERNWPDASAAEAKAEDGKAPAKPEEAEPVIVHFSKLDTPMQFILVFLTSVAIVGLGIAVVGLAYHHHRREREHAHVREQWE